MTGTAKTTRNRRLDCDAGCGYTVRLSRRWMDVGLPGCPCGGLLVPTAMEDAVRAYGHGHLTREQLAAVPEVAAHDAAVEAGTRAAVKRERRGDGRILSEAARCPSCKRYKPRPSATCGYCGDDPVRVGQDPREYDREHGWDWTADRDSVAPVDRDAIAARAAAKVYKERAAIAAANRLGALREHAFGGPPATDDIPF